nr:ABC transporter permease subunit [Galbitalea soli]
MFGAGFAWILAPRHWVTTAEGSGIGDALVHHLFLTAVSVLITVVIAGPLGLYIGHTGRFRRVAIGASNAARALPTLGLLSALILLLGIGDVPPVVVLVVLGIPPLLAGAYAGLESLDRQTIDAARAVGMTEFQILRKVEIPLAAPLLLGGLRAAALQIVATVALASVFGLQSLGTFIIDGLAQADYVKMTAGAILVAALALLLDGVLAVVQRLVGPRGVSRGTDRHRTTARDGKKPVALTQDAH